MNKILWIFSLNNKSRTIEIECRVSAFWVHICLRLRIKKSLKMKSKHQINHVIFIDTAKKLRGSLNWAM